MEKLNQFIDWGSTQLALVHPYLESGLQRLLQRDPAAWVWALLLLYPLWRWLRPRPRALRRIKDPRALRKISWQKFEPLTQALLKEMGFRARLHGGNRSDSGIDIIARRGVKKYIVQCKQWRRPVPVAVVREMFGVMHAESAQGAIIVTSGTFTKQAWAFAHGKPIDLIEGEHLFQLIQTPSRKKLRRPPHQELKKLRLTG